MRRADWTPLVLITASISVTVVAAVLLTTPWMRAPWQTGPGPTLERRHLSSQMQVWVGDMAPGVVGVLSPIWGPGAPDHAHDARLNEQLALPEARTLAWYHLLLFNRSEEAQQVSLGDGALTIRPPGGGEVATLTNVGGLVARGEATVSPALEAVLASRGVLSDPVEVPGGWMADLLVAFDRRVPLAEAVGVTNSTGSAFEPRPKTRRELEALVENPAAASLEDL